MAAALRHQGAKAKNRRVSRQMESESKSEEVFRQIAEDNDMLASEVSQWYLLNILEPGQWWYENFYRSSDKVGEFRASLGAKSPGLPRGNIRKIDDEAINPTEWWDDFLEAISESYTKTIQGRHLFSVSNFEATWAHAIDRIYEQTIEKGVFPAEYEKDSRERIFKILRWTFEDLELKKSALHTYFRRPGSPIEVPAQQDGNKKRQNLKSSPAAKSPTPKRYRSGTPSSDTAGNLTNSNTPVTTPVRASESPLFYPEHSRFRKLPPQLRAPVAYMGYNTPSSTSSQADATITNSEGRRHFAVVQTSEHLRDNLRLREQIRQLEHDKAQLQNEKEHIEKRNAELDKKEKQAVCENSGLRKQQNSLFEQHAELQRHHHQLRKELDEEKRKRMDAEGYIKAVKNVLPN